MPVREHLKAEFLCKGNHYCLLLQEDFSLEPGQCAWIEDSNSKNVVKISLEYRVPVYGHVSVYLRDAKILLGETPARQHWQLPVNLLLNTAKVNYSDFDPVVSCDLFTELERIE